MLIIAPNSSTQLSSFLKEQYFREQWDLFHPLFSWGSLEGKDRRLQSQWQFQSLCCPGTCWGAPGHWVGARERERDSPKDPRRHVRQEERGHQGIHEELRTKSGYCPRFQGAEWGKEAPCSRLLSFGQPCCCGGQHAGTASSENVSGLGEAESGFTNRGVPCRSPACCPPSRLPAARLLMGAAPCCRAWGAIHSVPRLF